MEIKDFIVTSREAANDEKLTEIVKSFINGRVGIIKKAHGLRDMFKFDFSSAGEVNREDYIAFKNELIQTKLRIEGRPLELMSIVAEKRKAIAEVNDTIIDILNNPNDLVLSTKGLLENDDSKELEHKFVINVPAKDFISVLKAIYDIVEKRELDDVRIITPTVAKLSYGISETITVKCSTKDLEYTVKMLEAIPEIYKAKCGSVPIIYPSLDKFYGYDKVDVEKNLTATENLGIAVYDAIVAKVVEFSKGTDKMLGELTCEEYIKSSKNALVACQKVLREYQEELLPIIIEEIKNKLIERNINISNIYEIPALEKALNETYKSKSVSELFEERQEKVQKIQEEAKEQVIKVPFTVTIPEEIKALEEQPEVPVEERNEAYLDSLLEAVETPKVEVASEVIEIPEEAPAPEVTNEESQKENYQRTEWDPSKIVIPDFLKKSNEVKEEQSVGETVIPAPEVVEEKITPQLSPRLKVKVSKKAKPMIHIPSFLLEMSRNERIKKGESPEEIDKKIAEAKSYEAKSKSIGNPTKEVNPVVDTTPIVNVTPEVVPQEVQEGLYTPEIPVEEVQEELRAPEIPVEEVPETEGEVITPKTELVDTVSEEAMVTEFTPNENINPQVEVSSEEARLDAMLAELNSQAEAPLDVVPAYENQTEEITVPEAELITVPEMQKVEESGEEIIIPQTVSETEEVAADEVIEVGVSNGTLDMSTIAVAPESPIAPEIPIEEPQEIEAPVAQPQAIETPVVPVAQVTEAPVVEATQIPSSVEVMPVTSEIVMENPVAPQVPVEVPEELTQAEVSSVVNDGIVKGESRIERAMKYQDFVSDLAILNNKVKGTEMTILEFFEQNDLLGKMSPNDIVELHQELGEPILASRFISGNVIEYLISNGEGDLDYIINLYATGIKKEETPKKKSLFGIFKK